MSLSGEMQPETIVSAGKLLINDTIFILFPMLMNYRRQ